LFHGDARRAARRNPVDSLEQREAQLIEVNHGREPQVVSRLAGKSAAPGAALRCGATSSFDKISMFTQTSGAAVSICSWSS
jgi:hypothetical protein